MTLAATDHALTTDGARVLIVDDHRTFADMLAWSLEGAGMVPVGTANSAAEAVAMAAELRPDIVVMDIEMPTEDGLSATRRIREVLPEAIVAIVTAYRDSEWVGRAAQAGASAFIPKDGSLTEMLDVLSHVRAGHLLVAPSTFAGSGPDSVPPQAMREEAPALTRREREVLECLGRGMQVKSIARSLDIGQETCRGYIKALHTKLGVRSQLQAVVRAQDLGLLERAD
jgi:DNA-binding NarL/FixJ family response regulator